MTEFIEHEFISEEDNTCEMDFNVEAPNDPRNEPNQLDDQRQGQNMENPNIAAEELERMFQEKLYLAERGKELRRLASDLLQQNKILSHEREQNERAFIKSEKDPKKIAEVIKSRLKYVHELCNERSKVYEDYITGSLKRLQEATFLNNENKVPLQERQSLIEDIFNTIKEQLETLETLQKPNYEELVLEEEGCFDTVEACFDTVMDACNKLEESCSTLTDMILKDYY